MECPFCSPEINHSVFYESAEMLAICNIAPVLPMHSLVIPRRHVESIFELSPEEFGKFFRFAYEVTLMLNRVTETVGFDWSLQESEEAGQTVPHLHLHIIPRKPGDLAQPGNWFAQLEKSKHYLSDSKERHRLNKEQIAEMVNLIKRKL